MNYLLLERHPAPPSTASTTSSATWPHREWVNQTERSNRETALLFDIIKSLKEESGAISNGEGGEMANYIVAIYSFYGA